MKNGILLLFLSILILTLGLSGCGKAVSGEEGIGGEAEIFDEKVFEEETPLIYGGQTAEMEASGMMPERTEKEGALATNGSEGAASSEIQDGSASGDAGQGQQEGTSGTQENGVSGDAGQGQQEGTSEIQESGVSGDAGQGQQGNSSGTQGSSGSSGGAGQGQQGSASGTQGSGIGTAPLQAVPYGALAVDGTQLVDSSGSPVQLRGVSTHGIAWYPGYVNEDCFRELKEEWGMNVVRLAMYTAENGGYCMGGDKDSLKALVKNGVEYATACGLYVIIDWHILSDGNPNTYIEESKTFFDEMSKEYSDYTNVLYEICNEPNGGVSWSEVKGYAEQIIEVIRSNDEDGVILVGTPNWSQYADQAAADPIQGYSNIMYTLHFYAATHKDSLRTTMINAVEAGLPIFVSEYGICDASGNGGIDTYEAGRWVDTMNTYGISYVAWNLSNKSETSAIIKSSCSKQSGFTEEELSDSGKWLYQMLGAAGTLGETANSNDVTASTNSSSTSNEDNNSGSGNSSGSSGSTGSSASGNTGQNGDGSTEGSGNADSVQNPSAGSGSSGAASSGKLLEGEDLQITAQLVNSWGQGNETFYQYSLTIHNLTDAEGSSWKVRLVFDSDITLNNGWNGNYQAEGTVLTITSMDYNGFIPAGGSTDNVGFIIQGAEDIILCSPF